MTGAEHRRASWLGDYLDDPRHGPLPALLLALTLTTGVIDSVSILRLGRVFVANMTGNIVFIGFGLAGAPEFALDAALLALAAFVLGAAVGGTVVRRIAFRGRLLAVTATAEVVLLAVATGLAVASSEPFRTIPRDTIAVLAAVGLGMQNVAARSLAVPDATTTVLTMTLSGFAAELRASDGRVRLRRLLAVAAMLLGAVSGALLVLRVDAVAALLLATALLAVVAVAAWLAARSPAAWQITPG